MKRFDLEHNNDIKSGFKVPDNYFEQFEAKMMEQISTEKETKVVSLFYRKQVWIGAIAAVFLIAIAIPVYFNMANNSNLDDTTIENYLVQQQGIGITELSKHLTDEDIVALENNLSLNETNTDAVEDYLSESENLDYYINEQ
jgi:propanediol dehydratase large subunit